MCLDHGHAHSPCDCQPAAPPEMEDRWPQVQAVLHELAVRLHDVRFRPSEKPLPPELDHVVRARIVQGLAEAIFADAGPGLRRSVARRMAGRIAEAVLWSRVTSFPVVHELVTLAAWWGSNLPHETFRVLRDLGLQYVVNGRVLPVDQVYDEILSAPLVYIGHCACRSSGMCRDLEDARGRVRVRCTPEEGRLLLDRAVDRYLELKARHGGVPVTDEKYVDLFERLSAYRRAGSTEYRIETLLRRTWPAWEILPVLDRYTQTWVRSLTANRKAHLLHPEIALELASVFYLGRGAVFTSMKCLGQPYSICTCPSPEDGGGCVLTNWYYHGMSNASLVPASAGYGRRQDASGGTAPCNVFALRASRECLGCGCRHGEDAPRGVATILAGADAVRRAHGLS